MKFNCYTITFKEDLDLQQQAILESSLAAAQDNLVKTVNQKLDNIEKQKKGFRFNVLKRLPFLGDNIENVYAMIEHNRQDIKANSSKYLFFQWPNQSQVKIFYCSEKLNDAKSVIPTVLDEKKIIDGLKKFIFHDNKWHNGMNLDYEPEIKKEEVEREE